MLGANELLLRSLQRSALLDAGLRRVAFAGAQSLTIPALASDTLRDRYATSHPASAPRLCSSSPFSQGHSQTPQSRTTITSDCTSIASSSRSSTSSSTGRSRHSATRRALSPSISTTILGAKSMAPRPLLLREPLADITAQSSVSTKAVSGLAAIAASDDSPRGIVGPGRREKRPFLKTVTAATGGVLSEKSLLKGHALLSPLPAVDVSGSPLCLTPLRRKGTVSGKPSAASVEAETEEGVSLDTPDGEGVLRTGGIHLILGPMFAGKTTALLRRVSAAKAEGKEVLLVKSGVDTRYSVNEVVSHDGEHMQCMAVRSLSDILPQLGQEAYDKVDVIGVDEAQFIQDIAFFAQKAADEHGKTLILAGLDADFMRRRFGGLVDLVPMADSVMKLQARCQVCSRGASFTLRKSRDMRTELVGGADLYMPVCRKCYIGAMSLVGSLPEVSEEEDSTVLAK